MAVESAQVDLHKFDGLAVHRGISRGMHALRGLQRLAHLKHAASVATVSSCGSLPEASACLGTAPERVLSNLVELTHRQQRRAYAGSPAPQQIRDFAIIGEALAASS